MIYFVLASTLLSLFLTCNCQDVSANLPDNTRADEKWNSTKRTLHLKKSFVKEWLLGLAESLALEYQTYDGWYNNPWDPSLGSSDSNLIRLLPPAYDGGIYKPVTRKDANPFNVSDLIMQEITKCSDHNESSSTGKNVFMVFFGQFVAEEVLDARKPACAPDYFDIPIPNDHYFYNTYNNSDMHIAKDNDFNETGVNRSMPFKRSNYDKKSGKSSNNRRKQLNSASAWIDGSVIYGKTQSRTQVLRAYKNGLLKSDAEKDEFPVSNEGMLSMLSPSRNHSDKKIKKPNFRIGNRLGHENPFVLTMNLIFFRWHNVLAKNLCENKTWDDDQCFHETRKLVIATLQNVIVNEWLPVFLGEELPTYGRYNPSIDPSISNAFQSAAMRFAHTMVPSAVLPFNKTDPKGKKSSPIRVLT